MILIICAHPYPAYSKANQAMMHAVENLPNVRIRKLYDLYPDFYIDVAAEQAALSAAHTIVLQHPLYWYSTPALLTLWFEKVLAHGWAYGTDGHALQGKRLLWATTTGADSGAYSPEGSNHFYMAQLAAPIEQTTRFWGMQWLPPHIVHDAANLTAEQLLLVSETYRDRLVDELTHLQTHAQQSITAL